MNQDRKRFMASSNPSHFNKSDKYRGILEHMPRLPMEFHRRYMNYPGRLLEPKSEFYRRYHFGDQNVTGDSQQNYNWYPNFAGYMKRDWYPRFVRQMYFPERFMDLSNFEMDMQGRWRDTQGRFTNPFIYNNQWRRYKFSRFSPHMHFNTYWYFLLHPERWMDMSGYQMDMQGRWMDMQGRPTHPFNNQGAFYDRQHFHRFHPYMSKIWRFMYWPERYMDMSGYQMDTQGRWMDMQGHYTNPFNQSGYNRQGHYPDSYGRNMFYPERWMDMSGYQMDTQGRWMDMQGRYTNPFNQFGYNRQGHYPGSFFGYHMSYPERWMDMPGHQMGTQGRWMDMQGRYTSPFNQFGSNRQGHYPGSFYGHNMFYPERWMDMSGYQMDTQGRWMDMQGRYTNPFSHLGYNRQGHPSDSIYGHNMFYPEKWMDMSGYQMDTQGRWMDMQGRYTNPFHQFGYNSQGHYPGSSYGKRMFYPERGMDMSGYQMDTQGRWMDMQGRHTNPFSHWRCNRQGHYPGSYYGRNMSYPERWMDMSGYQMDTQGRWMDMQGRHTNPFSHWGYNRQGHYPGSYYGRNMSYPERGMDMSGYQMDTQGRWMDMQGRHTNPFSHWGYNSHGYYPGSYGRNMSYPERWMDMSGYQMDTQGRWLDMQGRYTNPFNQYLDNRQDSSSGYLHGRSMFYPEKNMDMPASQMEIQGRWKDPYDGYVNPMIGGGDQRNIFGDDFGSNQGRSLWEPHQYMGMSTYDNMDMQGPHMRNMDNINQHQYGFYHQPQMFNYHGSPNNFRNMMGSVYEF